MAKNIYDTLHEQYMAYAKGKASGAVVENAVQWFYSQVKNTFGSSTTPFAVAEKGATHITSDRIEDGKMYLFEYSASKDEDYFDRFPLVIPFSSEEDRILGFNLHYIPSLYRVRAMSAILKSATPDRKYPPPRIASTRIDYSVVDGGALNYMRISVRTYLFRRIQSKIVEIPATGWLTAAFLPTASFRGSNMTPNKVTAEMLNQIRNL